MYIDKINIKNAGIFKNISIKFKSPNCATACPETGNIMNIIAGVNGCGKTTLLEIISDINRQIRPSRYASLEEIGEKHSDSTLPHNKVESKRKYSKTIWSFPEFNHINNKDKKKKLAASTKNIFYLNFGFSLLENNRNNSSQIFSNQLYHDDKFKELEDIIVKYIINLERRSRNPEPEQRTQYALDSFNKYFQGAKINSKVVDIEYSDGKNIPVFENYNGNKFSFSGLSHGEKALYNGVLLLIKNNYENCVILMDEPELGMHPEWQQQIIDIYSKIGKNNQFIIATHSPQIIASTPYQNIIALKIEANNIVPFYPRCPTGVDTNSILSQIMGVEKAIPEDIENMHKTYREFIKNRKENTSDAEYIKEKLLNRESNNSKFMQEMRLLVRLRGKK